MSASSNQKYQVKPKMASKNDNEDPDTCQNKLDPKQIVEQSSKGKSKLT